MSKPNLLCYPGIPNNFRDRGRLSEQEEEWWLAYGRHLEAARKNFDAVPTGLDDPTKWREYFPGRWQ